MKYLTENPQWINFFPLFNSSLYIEKVGYFDERPVLHTSITQLIMLLLFPFLLFNSAFSLLLFPLLFFGWGRLYINLPIKTGLQDCESPAWGFNYHNNTMWFYIGGRKDGDGKKWKTITMPWAMTWIRTSTLMKTGYDWFHETKTNKLNFGESKRYLIGGYDWVENNKWKETYEFVDKYDNTIVNATISVSEMEWRPIGLQWTSLFSKKRKTINVEFDSEVGKKKGSWKGGIMRCGYEMKEGESALDCLRRMEKERSF